MRHTLSLSPVLQFGALAHFGEKALLIPLLEAQVFLNDGAGFVVRLGVVDVVKPLSHLLQQLILFFPLNVGVDVTVKEEAGFGFVVRLGMPEAGRRCDLTQKNVMLLVHSLEILENGEPGRAAIAYVIPVDLPQPVDVICPNVRPQTVGVPALQLEVLVIELYRAQQALFLSLHVKQRSPRSPLADFIKERTVVPSLEMELLPILSSLQEQLPHIPFTGLNML